MENVAYMFDEPAITCSTNLRPHVRGTLKSAIHNGDERAGLPSASEYDRLLQCRASYLLSWRAHALGRIAHERSPRGRP